MLSKLLFLGFYLGCDILSFFILHGCVLVLFGILVFYYLEHLGWFWSYFLFFDTFLSISLFTMLTSNFQILCKTVFLFFLAQVCCCVLFFLFLLYQEIFSSLHLRICAFLCYFYNSICGCFPIGMGSCIGIVFLRC